MPTVHSAPSARGSLNWFLRLAGGIRFRCNVCGAHNVKRRDELTREASTCDRCGSTVRMRAVVHHVSMALFGRSLVLAEFPHRPDLRGIGLSDWPEYAGRLARRLHYANTFYHAQPHLDITEVPDELAGTCDFLISTDVFEHVAPPVDRAFAGAHRLLKPGGTLVLTVPFMTDVEVTREHFPELHDFRIVTESDKARLVNRRRDGATEVFDDLVFHGGPGSTLEMRVFAKADIERQLQAAGFCDIRFEGEPHLDFGIHWAYPWSVPIVARKPAQQGTPRLAPAAAAPARAHRELRLTFTAMASPCEIVVQGGESQEIERAGDAAVAEVRRIEEKYSRYLAASVVSRVNGGEELEADEETAALLEFAASLWRTTDGLFDITSGVLRRAWDFRSARLPSQQELDALLPLVGWDKVRWEGGRIRLPAGMEIDFGGFGKEYAADRAAAVLMQHGVRHALVNLGGDIHALGPRMSGEAWQVGIARPRPGGEGPLATLPLARGGLATSGDYERCFVLDGKRYCHILHPRTGRPDVHWQSVTVLEANTTAAGALSTVAMLRPDADAWLRGQGVRFHAVRADGTVTGA